MTAHASADDAEDRRLVGRFLARGDEEAFRALYRRHSPSLYRFAIRLAGDAAQGEDLLQETWIRGATLLASFRWESGLRTWLCGIAIRCRRELLRAERRRAESADRTADEETATTGSPEGGLDLELAIRTLPDGYREVLLLHDLHGYTHEEVGRLLEIDAGTSKSQLSRARRALRLRLAPARSGSGGMP